jgi:transposase
MEKKKYRSETWLREKALIECLSCKEIAELSNTTIKTIRRWMNRYSIPHRKSQRS